ncbi:site-specific integrase [Falsigemmobacter intermedius]|uniref:Site-specific integrase n=3 Tax=Falsigemmobacter intermedius TaxID=1553448 RepID=A0A3S3Y1M3_9RHOB|nr:site-specific integrase [Falsigemmobacter intermedius]RWY35486.1 site-specific integrase [Falsigemmobacter intermedius]
MTDPVASPVGREARARARGQSRTLLRARAEDLIAAAAPWLLRADLPVPAEAHAQLLELHGQILRHARSRSEAAGMNGVLQDLVDRHNARSRSSPVAAPGAITAVYSKDDSWRLEDPQFAAEARRLRAQYWKIREEGLTWQVSADQLFGLCLASALFESACLTPTHLQLFAQSLLSEETVLYRAEDVPVWLDLKERSHSSARRTRALSVASGKDAEGLYALRRLFLAPPTLRLISLFWNLPVTARQSIRPDQPVTKLLAKALGEPPPSLRLPQLLRGAALLREAEQGGPDHLLTGLAQRRIKSFAATPETWARALTGGAAAGEVLRKSPAVWSRELTAPPERRVTRLSHPVLQSEGYLRFYMALHDIRPEEEGAEESPAARRRRPGDLARDLRAARTGGDWPDVLCLLSDWYLHLLENEGLRPSSVERYDDTLGLRLCLHLEDLPLRELTAEDLEDLYGEILEDDPRSPAERRNLARRLRSLHDFAMSAWNFPKIDPETFSMEGDTPALRVRAHLLSFRDLTTARLSLASTFGLPPDLARTLQAAFLLMARCGLRIGEVCKALAAHFENPEGTQVPEEMATLFIRSSRFGSNKTPNALRQIRPMLLMTREERAFFSDWLAWRRSLSPAGPLFGILQPDGTFAPLDRLATGRLIAVALRGASGLSMVSAHDLRRTALNNIALALGEARAPALALTERLTGWTSEERRAVVQAVAGVSQRERWEALARFAGHGSVETTFLHYITCADLLIWQACASGEQKDLPADHLSGPAAERLFQLLPEPEEMPCDQSKRTWPSLQDSAAALHALRIALDCLDRGLALPRAAAAASLPEDLIVQTASVAKRWSALRSARGELRLQKKGDEGRLLPTSLPAPKLREALDLAARLIDLAADHPQAVYPWVRTTLSQASRTNAGVTFRDPADATAWIALAVQLRPAGRWQFERVSPEIDPDLRRERELLWQGVRPDEMQRAARRVARGSSVQVRLRLMAPNVAEQGARPAGSWAGVVTAAAHYAAIWLQLGPDQGAEDAEAVE